MPKMAKEDILVFFFSSSCSLFSLQTLAVVETIGSHWLARWWWWWWWWSVVIISQSRVVMLQLLCLALDSNSSSRHTIVLMEAIMKAITLLLQLLLWRGGGSGGGGGLVGHFTAQLLHSASFPIRFTITTWPRHQRNCQVRREPKLESDSSKQQSSRAVPGMTKFVRLTTNG